MTTDELMKHFSNLQNTVQRLIDGIASLQERVLYKQEERISQLEKKIQQLEQKQNSLVLNGNKIYHIHSWDQRIGEGGGIPSSNTTWSRSGGQKGISPTCYNPNVPLYTI